MNGLIENNATRSRAVSGVQRPPPRPVRSAATGAFDAETSDLDFVATFADTRSPGYADRYLGFAEALETLFGRPVYVITERSIRNPYFRQAVEASRQPIYDVRDAPAAA